MTESPCFAKKILALGCTTLLSVAGVSFAVDWQETLWLCVPERILSRTDCFDPVDTTPPQPDMVKSREGLAATWQTRDANTTIEPPGFDGRGNILTLSLVLPERYGFL